MNKAEVALYPRKSGLDLHPVALLECPNYIINGREREFLEQLRHFSQPYEKAKFAVIEDEDSHSARQSVFTSALLMALNHPCPVDSDGESHFALQVTTNYLHNLEMYKIISKSEANATYGSKSYDTDDAKPPCFKVFRGEENGVFIPFLEITTRQEDKSIFDQAVRTAIMEYTPLDSAYKPDRPNLSLNADTSSKPKTP